MSFYITMEGSGSCDLWDQPNPPVKDSTVDTFRPPSDGYNGYPTIEGVAPSMTIDLDLSPGACVEVELVRADS